MILRALSFLCLLCLAPVAGAQDNRAPEGKLWVQVAVLDRLDRATNEAERYARSFRYTRVFVAQEGRFAITLGVVDRTEAPSVLRNLIRQDRVPRDALTTEGGDYFAEIWSARRLEEDGTGIDPDFSTALAAEEAHTPDDRRKIQESLVWDGRNVGEIDGIFGPNTRSAIRSYQSAQSSPVTGYLTPAETTALHQRAESRRRAAGWEILEDGPLGLRIGLATAYFDQPETVDVGLRLSGRGPASGALLSLLSFTGGRSVDSLYDSAKREFARDTPILDRRSAEGFTLIGRSGSRLIYTHAKRARDGTRGFIFSFDSDSADLLTPVAQAMLLTLEETGIRARPRIADAIEATPRPRRDEDRDTRPERRPDTRPDPRPDPDERAPRTSDNTGGGTVGTRPFDRADRTEPRTERPRTERPRTERPRTERPRTERPPAERPRTERPRRDDPRRRREDRPRREGEVDSTGTGFYVSADGRIVTNFHVVDGCRQMIVDGGDEVEVLAVDRVNDLALLSHQVTRTDAQIARFAPSGPRLNSDVTVVGYPLYGLLGGLNVTRGVVSSLKGLRGDETFIQISAEVQPGNSGGPALNARGYVVGVVQSKLDAVRLSERIGDIPQNVNFAIRAGIAQTFLKANGVEPLIGGERDRLEPADLAEAAQEFTVLLECIK